MGPIQVSEARRLAAAPQAFIESAVAAGFTRFRDVNGGWHEGVGPVQLNVEGGVRGHPGACLSRPACRARTSRSADRPRCIACCSRARAASAW